MLSLNRQQRDTHANGTIEKHVSFAHHVLRYRNRSAALAPSYATGAKCHKSLTSESYKCALSPQWSPVRPHASHSSPGTASAAVGPLGQAGCAPSAPAYAFADEECSHRACLGTGAPPARVGVVSRPAHRRATSTLELVVSFYDADEHQLKVTLAPSVLREARGTMRARVDLLLEEFHGAGRSVSRALQLIVAVVRGGPGLSDQVVAIAPPQRTR